MNLRKSLMATSIVAVLGVTSSSLTGCFMGASVASALLSQVVSGTVTRDSVQDATVYIYALNPNGSDGALLATTKTDANGNFSVTLSLDKDQMIVARVSDGKYLSENTKNLLFITSPINAMTKVVAASENVTINLNAITDMSYARAYQLVLSGRSLDSAKAMSDAVVKQKYGLLTAPELVKPSFNANDLTTESGKVAMVLAGLDKLANNQQACAATGTLDALYAALSKDISDGNFDGAFAGSSVELCGQAMPVTLGTLDYTNAINAVAPEVFGLIQTTKEFEDVKKAVDNPITILEAPTEAPTQAPTEAPTLEITQDNLRAIMSSVLAFYNSTAGSPGGTSSQQIPLQSGNQYSMTYQCYTSGNYVESITDNNANFLINQMADSGDIVINTYNSCYGDQNFDNAASGDGVMPFKRSGTSHLSLSVTNTLGGIGSFQASYQDEWGNPATPKQRSLQIEGLANTTFGESGGSLLNMTNYILNIPNELTLTSSNAKFNEQRSLNNGYSLSASGVLELSTSSFTPNISGKVIIPENQVVTGEQYRCALAGNITVQGANANAIISINSGSYASIGLDSNKDGVVDGASVQHEKVCAINFTYLK